MAATGCVGLPHFNTPCFVLMFMLGQDLSSRRKLGEPAFVIISVMYFGKFIFNPHHDFNEYFMNTGQRSCLFETKKVNAVPAKSK